MMKQTANAMKVASLSRLRLKKPLRMSLSYLFGVTVAFLISWNLYSGSIGLKRFETSLDMFRSSDWTLGDKKGGKKGSRNRRSKFYNRIRPEDDDPSVIPQWEPTNKSCQGYQGIYHIAMGDIGGAAGTIFFQFVIGQLIYAEKNNLLPWIHLDNVSWVVYDPQVHGQGPGIRFTAMAGRNATWISNRQGHWRDSHPGPLDYSQPVHPQNFTFKGTGVWEHYFEPVSDFVPGDASCESKLYVTLPLKLITPGIHGFSSWAPKCWRYPYLPDYITKPHIPITEWLEPQRTMGFMAVKKYIRPRPYLRWAAQQANPNCSLKNACLGLHIRHSDKAAGRRQVPVSEFLPFCEVFVHAGGKYIYLATDSTKVLKEVNETWPQHIVERIRTIGDQIIRSSDDTAVFDIGSHHRTNQEVLTEIYALSRCQFMVHGLSAVSESAIWINLKLHRRSVNLEDPDHLGVHMFGTLVQMVLRGEEERLLPYPTQTNRWWKQVPPRETRRISHTACDGFDGVLLISGVGRKMSAGAAFFNSVLNQLIYAEMYNLKPYVHLGKSAQLVYDPKAHAHMNVSIEMMHGMTVSVMRDQEHPENIYPGAPARISMGLSLKEHRLEGNGIWESYFKPVSDFVPGDTSCRVKPLIAIEDQLLTPGLDSFAPWAIRTWQYDTLPGYLWNTGNRTLKEWYQPIRQKAHELVKKHIRFQPQIIRRAQEVNPVVKDKPCLAVHLRNGDKDGQYRQKLRADKFRPYLEAFHAAGGQRIYIASDSHRTLQYIHNKFPSNITEIIRTQGGQVARTYKEWPSHMLDSHHRINSEALVDVLAMSKCQVLLHGFSTISEATIYLNPTLHNNSVNLEDPNHLSPGQFEGLVHTIISQTSVKEKQQTSFGLNAFVEDTPGIVSMESVDDAKILSRKTTRQCRNNAIVYLAQKKHSSYDRDSYRILLQSLDHLHANYLSIDKHIDNTDLFIFHTGDFDQSDLEAIESRFGSSYKGAIRLVDLSGSPYWARPQHNANDDPNSWYAYPLFSEGYRRMMHWYAIDIWDFFDSLNKQTQCNYRYLFRLDEDSFIHSPIRYDIFDFMQSNEYIYGYRMCAYEMKVARHMWQLWSKRHEGFTPKRNLDLNMCGFYNNFFVADLQFFRRKSVVQFLRFIDRQGQIYRRRLGDLMIHTMSVIGFGAPGRIHRFLDFTYEHGTFNETTGCLIWGGIQAGYDDPNATETLAKFYQSNLLDRHCPGNASFLPEEDLSPTYAHIPAAIKGSVMLHTITAGNVEIPKKGILSG